MYGADDVYAAYKLIKEILNDIRKGKEEKFAVIESDLVEVITELSGILRTMVGIVRLMRKLPNRVDKFPQAFDDFYIDFKLSVDANPFEDARTRCHKIDLIHKRLNPGLPRLWNRDRANKINSILAQLTHIDTTWFNEVARWMYKANEGVAEIQQLVQQEKTTAAIAVTKLVVSSLSGDFIKYKMMLKKMNDTISELKQQY